MFMSSRSPVYHFLNPAVEVCGEVPDRSIHSATQTTKQKDVIFYFLTFLIFLAVYSLILLPCFRFASQKLGIYTVYYVAKPMVRT